MKTGTTLQLITLIVCAFLKLHGCPNAARAHKLLEAEGYSEVRTFGPGSGYSCGTEWSATSFSAKTLAGHPAKGVVCCGLLVKACTVRLTEVQ